MDARGAFRLSPALAVPVIQVPRPPRHRLAEAKIPPGPNAGRTWPEPAATHRDPLSDRRITRLTSYRGHSHHLAGATPCWLEDGARLVIVSDRDGCGNLFAYDFAAATLTQLTDLRGRDRPTRVQLTGPAALAFRYGAISYELELDTLCLRPLRGPKTKDADVRRAETDLGEAILPDGRRAVWLDSGGSRRTLALTAGSGLGPHAMTAPCRRPRHEQVLFVSDGGGDGYAQIYSVEASEPAKLPLLSAPAQLARSSVPRAGRKV